MTTVFLTGFPGFLGSSLVERLLSRYPQEVTLSCLIQKKYRRQAEERAAALTEPHPEWAGRIRLYEGDVTRQELGLGDQYEPLQAETVEIYHLAAVYDLGVNRELAMEVNVRGTENMLALAQGCPGLQRFQYVSTLYVSGKYPGIFTEEDLSVSQQFNNYYEESKYLAELAVQQAMAGGLPATIYRPAIITGDSQTGATQKYDGPYYFIRWLLRQPESAAILPMPGNPDLVRVNVVPRDFVVNAITYLSGIEVSAGKVYHLCDPDPLTVSEMATVIGEATGRRLIRVPVAKGLAKWALEYVPGVEELMGIEPESIEYFVLPAYYTCENMLEDLAGTGIACPSFPEYVDNLVAFMREHPDISSEAMV
jgi:thioester reductase-like protein